MNGIQEVKGSIPLGSTGAPEYEGALDTNPCSGRDSNPHEVNPHRVLNPARLPIPPPEQIRFWCTPFGCTSGAEGNRTPDLLNAIQALSRLSYGPSTINLYSVKQRLKRG